LTEAVESLVDLLPAGRHAATDLRGHATHVDVFVTFERRGGTSVPCGFRIIANRCEFALDDGCDEFARTTLAGPPTFDPNRNVQISAVRRNVEGRRRGTSLWLAHDLSMIAIDDELVYLK
jgi:hypothetical protein